MDDRGTPLEFLQDVMDCEELPLSTRMRAAIAAAPYRHPKLGVVVNLTGEDMKSRLIAASKRVEGLDEVRKLGREAVVEYIRSGKHLPKVIEGEVSPPKESA
jgi:hypothetical protein